MSWVSAFALVDFDLDLGQSYQPLTRSLTQCAEIELSVPPGRLERADEAAMCERPWSSPSDALRCFHAFPDSMSGILGNATFFFSVPLSIFEGRVGFGYVLVRQYRDTTLRRGYFQKALVLVSEWPFTRLFSAVVSVVAPGVFNHGESWLEQIMTDIKKWFLPSLAS
jgi:hypothetical protein